MIADSAIYVRAGAVVAAGLPARGGMASTCVTLYLLFRRSGWL